MRYITIRIMPSDEATYQKRKKQVIKIANRYSKRDKKKISLNLALNILVEEEANKIIS